MRPKLPTPDHKIAAVAARQHGVITLGQLLAAGLSREAVKRRARKGLLHREFRGIYRVGHRAPSTEARYAAAVLACGPGAALADLAAAFLYGLFKGSPPEPTVITRVDRRPAGIASRHVRRLDRRDLTTHRGIAITTVPEPS